MHRTTTTATLLVTVAVTALSGCVTVQRPPVPGPPAAPSQQAAPRSDGRTQPQIMQAPAREALEMIGPSHRPDPTSAASHGVAPSTAPRAQEPPPRTRPTPPGSPERRHPDVGHPGKPRVEIPDVAESIPRDAQDVCALGKQYGGWEAGGPESTICDQMYGR